MEKYIKDLLKKIKLNEPTISTILGALVILAVMVLIFKYFKAGKSTTQENLESIKQDELQLNPEESGIPENLPESYKVLDNDSLWKISQNFYQSGYNWVDIAKVNDLVNPDYLEVGQELKLPKVAVRKPEVAAVAVEATSSVQIKEVSPAQADNQVIKSDKYLVAAGDCLWQIVIRAYGDGYKWPEIAKANNLLNPDYLEIGQELKLPR